MKRLTKTYSDGSFGVADDLPCGENSYDFKNLLIKTLGEYEDADENRLLVRLPRKVWDIVWLIKRRSIIAEGQVFKAEWKSVGCGTPAKLWIDIDGMPYLATDFGKTVFLTREEAEAELEKMENER